MTDLWGKGADAPGLWKRLLGDVPCPELLFSEIGDLIKEESERKPPLETAALGKRFDAAMRLAAMAAEKRPADPAGWFKDWKEKQYWDVADWITSLPWGLARAGRVEQAEALSRAWAPATARWRFSVKPSPSPATGRIT
ncbi:MAG: hypothetical protein KGJ84_01010 [Elusimicrobia bacterium]|nr:hypothetical protein [Elusimicrobiota bacterium]